MSVSAIEHLVSVSTSVMSDESFIESQHLAKQLQDATRQMIAEVPRENRSATELARYVEVERTMCQRLITACSAVTAGPELLSKIPGPKALLGLADALKKKKIPTADQFRAAVMKVEDFFETCGGSQRGYTNLLLHRPASPVVGIPDRRTDLGSIHVQSTPKDKNIGERQRLFESAREIVRAWAKIQSRVFVIAPAQDGSNMLEVGHGSLSVGYQSSPYSAPLFKSAVRYLPDEEASESTTKEAQFITPYDPLLTDFCSNPLPPMSVDIQDKGKNRYLSYTLKNTNDFSSFDFGIFTHTKNAAPSPPPGEPRCDETWAMIDFPTEVMIFDVYQHRDIARRCIPGLDVHLWRPDVGESTKHRARTRMAIEPELTVLENGLRKADSIYYSRQSELTAEVFRRLGHDPANFIGYRCERAFPEWRLGFRMFFDFGVVS